MDKAILGGLLIFFIVAAALAGVILIPKTGMNNIMGTLTTVNNSSDKNSNVIPASNNLITLFPSSLGYHHSQQTPSPTPSPAPDPMNHIISLFDAYVKSLFPQTGIPGAAWL